MRRATLIATIVAGALLIAGGVVLWVLRSLPPAHSDYVPRDPLLRRPTLYFYLPRPPQPPPAALVVFFGNDVGFWAAHQELASDLQAHGYAVVGWDIKPLIESLPRGDTPQAAAERAAVFSAQVDSILSATRHELALSSAPVVLMGHSFGAELALWTAAHVAIPGLRGVVAIAPAARGHLAITARDLANIGSPREPGSFSVAQTVSTLGPELRVALVRGEHDRLRGADSAIVAAGGARLRYWLIPFASHSLRNVIVARYAVRGAVDWVANLPPR